MANWIETELVGGKIISTREAIPSFSYNPAASDLSIPLHAASSMITELAPLILSLRRASILRQIIIEEPEAHLHLSAQRVMARAIARLVNSGVQVVVTTHSDTLIQQLNNLIKMFEIVQRSGRMHPDYQADDLLNPRTVGGYEFRSEGSHTIVAELTVSEEGLVVPSLGETLIDLSSEALNLSDELGDGAL